MAVCERCGSIQVVRLQPSLIDRGLTLLDSRKPYKCRRCGWKGRRGFGADASSGLVEVELSDGTTDPSLSVLDDMDRPGDRASGQGPRPLEQEPSSGEFNLSLTEGSNDREAELRHRHSLKQWNHRRRNIDSRRLKRSRRRQVLGSIVISTLILLVGATVGLSSSCGGSAAL